MTCDLPKHLRGDKGEEAGSNAPRTPSSDGAKAGKKESLATKDYALYEALNLLKGLTILGKDRS